MPPFIWEELPFLERYGIDGSYTLAAIVIGSLFGILVLIGISWNLIKKRMRRSGSSGAQGTYQRSNIDRFPDPGEMGNLTRTNSAPEITNMNQRRTASSNPTENNNDDEEWVDDGDWVDDDVSHTEAVGESQPYNPEFQPEPELPPSYEASMAEASAPPLLPPSYATVKDINVTLFKD